uniref:Histone-lysine N-methyltransferase n=2 Tax=Caenorhabditis japonica TaxID=281687 RepID=A0A8R1HKP3_CAEJA
MHHEQQPQYRYVGPPPPPPHQAEPHHQQPSTSANPSTSTSSSSSTLPQGVMHPIPIQMRPSTSSTSSSAATRPPPSLVRIGHGHPIKLGENILQPAGTLVFSSQGDGGAWTSGQRVLVHAANKHNVVQANLYPIGMTLQTANGNWYLNQHPVTTTATSSSNNAANTTNSSATPDSGIQSVPTSPPSPRYEMTNEQERYGVDEEEEEDDDDPADFTDMPTLKPADEDDCYDMPSTSAGPPVADQTSPTIVNSHIPSTSTATAPTPREDLNGMNPDELFAISIEKNMDLDEIVQRLINFDPEKAAAIAMLIKKKCAEEVKKKKDLAEAEVSSTTPTTPRAVRGTTRKRTKVTRNTNSPDVTTSAILPEEHSTVEPDGTEPGEVELEEAEVKTPGKRRGRKPKKRRNKDEENAQESPGSSEPAEPVKKMKQSFAEFENPTTSCSPPSQSESVQFRLKVRKMMERQLEVVTERMAVDMTELRLGHGHGHGPAPTGKRKESFFRQLAEQSKKIKKGNLPKRLKMFMAPEEKTSQEPEDVKPIKEEDVKTDTKPRGRLPSSRRSRVEDSEEKLTSVEEKFNGEYYEISRSVIPPGMTDEVLPLWKASNLTCGCTKGGCTSDMDCLNRAMRVQCSSECTLPYCSNRKFWKEDQNKLCVSNGPKSLRALKTRVARRAGEFLCEYAGEMITCQEAVQRSQEKPDSRIIAIGPQLFVDATTRANIARFVKHSCRPNCRLEVWSVNGVYRAGVFALVDLAANVDITVDKSHWIPCDQPCKCLAIGCKKTIRGVNMRFFNAPDEQKKNKSVFLARNRRSTLNRYQSGLPAILQSPNTSDAENSALQQMKKVLAAFIYRYRRVDGSLPRSSLPFYTSICKFLKNSRPNARIDEFNGLFRKWLEKIDDDDLERAFNAIKSHYLNPQLVARSKKQKENAPRARAPSTSCQPSPIPRSNADLSYLDSIHPV